MGLMLLTACGGSQQDVAPDNPLIGRWTWDAAPSYPYVFNADGTGYRGSAMFGGRENFTWWTTHNDSRLQLRISNPIQGTRANQGWDITWSNNNNRITLDSRIMFNNESYSYSRAD